MEWIIVTDSGCDLLPGELAPNIHLRRVPLSILLGEEEWVDGADMDRERFLTAMEAYKGKSSSACPSPETWARAFSEGDHVIAITITGGLSAIIPPCWGATCSGRNSPINPSMFWIPVLPERRSRCWFSALAS